MTTIRIFDLYNLFYFSDFFCWLTLGTRNVVYDVFIQWQHMMWQPVNNSSWGLFTSSERRNTDRSVALFISIKGRKKKAEYCVSKISGNNLICFYMFICLYISQLSTHIRSHSRNTHPVSAAQHTWQCLQQSHWVKLPTDHCHQSVPVTSVSSSTTHISLKKMIRFKLKLCLPNANYWIYISFNHVRW